MNIEELATFLEKFGEKFGSEGLLNASATTLRQQQAEIEALKREAALQRLSDFTQEVENKPVAWYNADDSSLSFKNHGGGWQPLYTHPVKTLTDEEILKMAADKFHYSEYKLVIDFARAILRKAQEK
jgi:hypothetical protein